MGGEIFHTCPDRPWGPPSLLYNGYLVFPGGKERPGRDANPSPFLVPWSWKGRAIPLLPQWAVRPVQSLSACTEPQCLYKGAIYLYLVFMLNSSTFSCPVCRHKIITYKMKPLVLTVAGTVQGTQINVELTRHCNAAWGWMTALVLQHHSSVNLRPSTAWLVQILLIPLFKSKLNIFNIWGVIELHKKKKKWGSGKLIEAVKLQALKARNVIIKHSKFWIF